MRSAHDRIVFTMYILPVSFSTIFAFNLKTWILHCQKLIVAENVIFDNFAFRFTCNYELKNRNGLNPFIRISMNNFI